ncbi:nucleotide sugar dehydrogenase [Campylobacter sp. 19-13652]|uniref:nucleotide sugar dehydrogenase n=1 Tax=Campylobacter sp. 19-13652 TaxID=2840180 RepID=UPI001C741AC3|nr:nucleotide sugar dehydrogenase [Campylobacter sp. 19-13652]BCX79943.1 Vi polysaccharide biosynthesis protein VipA/TviB [Campylobacter sp. 19-13652]
MRKIALIGLGYVGLPLGVALSAKHEVIGFDINKSRIDELNEGFDRTLEVDSDLLNEAKRNGLRFSSDAASIADCDFYIVTVPTPVDSANQPDLRPVIGATKTVASVLKRGDIVVYESTVYPGVTQEVCVPILEEISGLKFNQDFECGYSPERINPGDKEHTVTKIRKIVSASSEAALDIVDSVYSSVITAGTYRAQSIKVAEAAKVIENTQRDINIAFVNELAMLFNRLDIDTNAVLDAASTKWNFLNFRPGLVGGHCIGVDPYYLTHKATQVGYHPEIILAGRRINDEMGRYVASSVVKMMIKHGVQIKGARVLVCGITFKENCPDIRNSRVIDVVRELGEFGCCVSVCDPWASEAEVEHEYGISILKFNEVKFKDYDCVVLAVAHNEFKNLELNGCLVYDIKNIYKNAEGRL